MENLNPLLKLSKEKRQELLNSKSKEDLVKLICRTSTETLRLLEDLMECESLDESHQLVRKATGETKNVGGRPSKLSSPQS
jgi:hypothetical protein